MRRLFTIEVGDAEHIDADDIYSGLVVDCEIISVVEIGEDEEDES